MNLEQITRNAENQVAASLKSKVERFMSSKKKEKRIELATEIDKLTGDLVQIVGYKYDPKVYDRPVVAPLPAKRRSVSFEPAHESGRELTPVELAERNKRIKEDLAEDKRSFNEATD